MNRHLRNLQTANADAFDRLGSPPPDSTAAFLGRVIDDGALSTTPDRVVLVNPVEVDGTQGEGDTPTFTADVARKIPVVALGDKAPVVDDYLNVFAAGGRWVAETGCGKPPDSDCPGGGTLCVNLNSVCTGNGNGYTVVVKAHGTGTVVATGTTSVTTVCFTLPPGFYDVTATRSGCSSASWTNQEVTCGATTNLTADALCQTDAAINFTILGCHSHPLPDASIAITGPDSGTIVTGSDGKATFYTTHTGTFSYTITHPSGRFNPITGSVTKSSLCTAASVNRTMTAATGYNCCAEFGALWAGVNPYPVPNTLYVTDDQGFTLAVTIDSGTCNGAACSDRSMDECSAGGPAVIYSCVPPPGLGQMPPTDIGTNTTALLWGLTLGGPGVLQLKQQHPMYPVTNGMTYVANGDVSKVCSPQDTRRTWRLAIPCPYDGSHTYRSDVQASAAVNSVYPLNISFTFSGGLGFGPTAIANNVDGQPYALSATVHE